MIQAWRGAAKSFLTCAYALWRLYRNPNERVKLTVTILDQDLRADALRVAASRQVAEGGNWVEAPVQAATVQKLEDIILTKARDLRRQALQS